MASEALAAITLKPAAMVVIAILIVALVLSVALTVLIRRGTRAGRATPKPAPHARSQPARRPAAPAEPVDMQDRLRRLTSVYDTPNDTPDYITAPSHGSGPLILRTTGALSMPAAPAGLSAPPALPELSTHGAGIDDATRFFGDAAPEPDADSTTYFGADEGLPDSTTYFGADEGLPDSTTYFGADEGLPDSTTYFGSQEEVADATAYFGPAPDANGSALNDEDGTRFFGLDDDAEPAASPSETRYFGPLDEQEDHTHSAAQTQGDRAGMPAPPLTARSGPSQAPSTTLKNELCDDEGHALPSERQHATHDAGQRRQQEHDTPHETHDDEEDLMASTGFLAALPPSSPSVDAAALEIMRARLAAVTAPEVLALSVIDGGGRVLAGEAGDDLAGELHALMDESGLGQAADIEQPVRLADNSPGVIMLLPTGAGALLGALLRDGENPGATRDSLRGLAHEIGDALRRAS